MQKLSRAHTGIDSNTYNKPGGILVHNKFILPVTGPDPRSLLRPEINRDNRVMTGAVSVLPTASQALSVSLPTPPISPPTGRFASMSGIALNPVINYSCNGFRSPVFSDSGESFVLDNILSPITFPNSQGSDDTQDDYASSSNSAPVIMYVHRGYFIIAGKSGPCRKRKYSCCVCCASFSCCRLAYLYDEYKSRAKSIKNVSLLYNLLPRTSFPSILNLVFKQPVAESSYIN